MGSQRAVEVAAKDGGYIVTTFCQSLAEAMAAVDKILRSPPPVAFFPASVNAEDLANLRPGGIVRGAPPDESDLPPHAIADADDNVGDLKAGEAFAGGEG